jgi:hypothetical protein
MLTMKTWRTGFAELISPGTPLSAIFPTMTNTRYAITTSEDSYNVVGEKEVERDMGSSAEREVGEHRVTSVCVGWMVCVCVCVDEHGSRREDAKS